MRFVGQWERGWFEVSALVRGYLGLKAGKSHVCETPRVSVIEDSSFCPTTRWGGPPIWAGVFVELQQTPMDDIRSARAARGRRTSYSQLVHRCS